MNRFYRCFLISLLFGTFCSVRATVPATNLPPQKQILFICTGNYYRSRFAEALFNQEAADAHLPWRAVSRGLQLDASQRGISIYSKRELLKRGVSPELCKGEPQPLHSADLEKSDYIVLMDEAEHRPLLQKHFPVRDDSKIHYWHIAESGKMPPANACQAMSTDIQRLLEQLQPVAH